MFDSCSEALTVRSSNTKGVRIRPIFCLALIIASSGLVGSQEEIAQVDLASRPVLAAPGDITGRLVDIDGVTPHPKVRVQLIRLPENNLVGESITNQVGEYGFTNVAAGEYNLRIGQATVRLLAAEGLTVQPINLVIPKFLLTAMVVAPGVVTPPAAAAIPWTTAAWVGGTIVIVGGTTIGIVALTDNLDLIGLGDDDEAILPSIPETPPAPPGSP